MCPRLLHLGRGNAGHKNTLGDADGEQSSRKGPRGAGSSRLNVSQQCAMAVQGANTLAA